MLKVKLEKPRAIKDDPAAIAKWERSVPVAMATALAHHIRERIQERGDLARGYLPANEKPRIISPRYPGAGAGRETSSGARFFPTDAAFRAAIGARADRFSPSGGMWDGLSVVSRGGRAAEDLFRGRSEGQDPGIFRYADGRRRARGRKISNALKAWTVLEKTGINILELKDDELHAAEGALTDTLAEAAVAALGVNARLESGRGSHPLYQTLRGLLIGRS